MKEIITGGIKLGKVLEVKSKEELENLLEEGKDGNILLDFHAEWCMPCKQLAPQLDQLAQETDIDVLKINVDEVPELATEYEVMGIPALKAVKNKEIVNQASGFMPAEALKQLF